MPLLFLGLPQPARSPRCRLRQDAIPPNSQRHLPAPMVCRLFAPPLFSLLLICSRVVCSRVVCSLVLALLVPTQLLTAQINAAHQDAVQTNATLTADMWNRYEAVQSHMGVRFRIVVYAKSDEHAAESIEAAFAEIARMNRIFSDYDPESELSKLGTNAKAGEWVPVSVEFWELSRIANQVSRDSHGAFDMTLGPLTRLWRRARKDGELPERSILQSAIAKTGYQKLVVDAEEPRVQLKSEDMRFDAGGIAKGFAADRALAVLESKGITSALIDASGDITLGAAPPEQKGWNVGIAPLDAQTPVSRKINLASCAIATSGDAWQAIEINGERYSHIIDPKTGLGLKQRSSVTVIAPTGALADAWASAVSVLGPDQGIQIINQHNDLQAWVVTLQDGKPTVSISEGFPATEPVVDRQDDKSENSDAP